MKLSFIIPAYNEEKYLGECLSSILALGETMPPHEIIVADNNSTDGTVNLVRKNFPDVKVVTQSLPGPAAARNAGAAAASGNYLAFIDADCRLPQDWWTNVRAELELHPELLVLYGPYWYYESKTFWQKFAFYVSNVLSVQLSFFVGLRLLGLGAPAFGGDTIVKKSSFERLAGFAEKFDFYGEDIDFIKRAARLGKVKFVPRIWVYSSDRRLRKEGVLKMWWIYTINYFGVILLDRALYRKHRPVP